MADIINGTSDADFANFARQFQTVATVNPADYGLTMGQLTDLNAAIQTFRTDLAAHIAAQASARTARQAKDDSRENLEQILRSYFRIVKASPGITDAKLSALGIPIADSSDAAPTATRPVGAVDTSERLRHTIDFRDEAAPNNKRKPAGVVGCEIFVKIDGAPPVDDGECDFLTLDTATPYVAQFDGAQAGKMAHYMFRWRLKDGVSPWGTTVSATITG